MRLFVSKTPEDSLWLRSFCDERKWKLEAQSLIHFFPLSFELPTTVEMIFFSSKNGVQFFLEKHEIKQDWLVACVGRETANELKKNNIEPQFVGENSGDPVSVGKELLAFAGKKHIFFPTSHLTKGTIANLFPTEQKTTKAIYRTEFLLRKIPPSDIYLFSSPSNVEAFFQSNEIPASAKTIAWGKITEKTLLEQGIFPEYVLKTGQKEELLAFLTKF